MTAGNNHSGKLDARFHSSTVAGEARVKENRNNNFPIWAASVWYVQLIVIP
jgi:hypothetical protein